MTKLREKEPATILLFCRHGVTDFPEDRFYPGDLKKGWDMGQPEEPGLSELGRHQAERLAGYLAEVGPVDALYVSPTLRTRQTMQPIAQGLDLSPTIIPELKEREMGQWGGCAAEEIQQRDPEGWRRWKSEPISFAPPDGESLLDFSHRVAKAMDLILEKEAGRTVVVVTHVGPIRVTTAAALGVSLENCKRLVLAPGSVTRIHYTKSWPNLVLFGYQPS